MSEENFAATFDPRSGRFPKRDDLQVWTANTPLRLLSSWEETLWSRSQSSWTGFDGGMDLPAFVVALVVCVVGFGVVVDGVVALVVVGACVVVVVGLGVAVVGAWVVALAVVGAGVVVVVGLGVVVVGA